MGNFDISALRLPLVLQALENNYTAKKIKFFGSNGLREYPDKKTIDCVLRLNNCNRWYLQDDPGNKRAGLQLLADVGDDLDCIFYHLRENPLLVWHGCAASCKQAELTRPSKRCRLK